MTRDDFARYAESFAVYGADACRYPAAPFHPTSVPVGFRPVFVAGGGPGSEDAADDEDWSGNKGFYLAGSTRDRGIDLYRANPAWSPADERQLIDVLGTKAWLGRSLNLYTVELFYGDSGEPCDFYAFVSGGVSRAELRRLAEGLVPA